MARLALRFDEWPAAQRAAWEAVTCPATGLFAPSAPANHVGPATLRSRAEAFSLWLGFLSQRGEGVSANPAALATPARLDAYVDAMRVRGNRDSTIRRRLESLAAAIRLMDPRHDVSPILRPGGRSLRRALPEQPRDRPLHDFREIRDRAIALFHQGMAGQGYAKGRVAIRDAAIIGIFATRAPRNGAFATLGIDAITRIEGRYWLTLPAETSKTGHPLRYPLEPALTPVLDQYLNAVRPAWGGAALRGLWLGPNRREIVPAAVAHVVRVHTRRWFGVGFGPHWLRHCLTTTAVLQDPQSALDAAIMLGHSPQVALQHYNHATAVVAAERLGARVTRLQRETEALARNAFGWSDGKPAQRLKRTG